MAYTSITVTHSTDTYTEFSINFHGYSINTTFTGDLGVLENWIYSLPECYQDRFDNPLKPHQDNIIGIDIQSEPLPHFVVCAGYRCLIYKLREIRPGVAPDVLKFFVGRNTPVAIGYDVYEDFKVLHPEFLYRQDGVKELMELIGESFWTRPNPDFAKSLVGRTSRMTSGELARILGERTRRMTAIQPNRRMTVGSSEQNAWKNDVLKVLGHAFLGKVLDMPDVIPRDERDMVTRSSVITFLISELGRMFRSFC